MTIDAIPTMQQMHSLDVFRHYDRSHWRFSDIPLERIDRALVKPEYVTLVKSAVMGESNVIAAVHGFLNEFADDYDFSAFAVVWGYQEVQHHYGFTLLPAGRRRGRGRPCRRGDARAVRAGLDARRPRSPRTSSRS